MYFDELYCFKNSFWESSISRDQRNKEILQRGLFGREIEDVTKKLEGLGFSPIWLDFYKKWPGEDLGFYYYKLSEDAKTINDLESKGFSIPLSLSVLLKAGVDISSPLICKSQLNAGKITIGLKSFDDNNSLLKVVSRSNKPWPSFTWPEVLKRMEECRFGIILDKNVREHITQNFGHLFDNDQEGMLVWCDITERLYYAIETRRIISHGKGGILQTLQDPITFGISTELRGWVAEQAELHHVRMSDILIKALTQMRASQERLLGLRLLFYNAETQKWGQANSRSLNF